MKKLYFQFLTIALSIAVSFASFAQAPVITSFDPSEGWAGQVIEITGTNFNNVTDAAIGNTSAIILNKNENSVRLLISETASTGILRLTNVSGDGFSQGAFTALPFNIFKAPSLMVNKMLDGYNSEGTSMSISADNNTIAIGAPEVGKVRILRREGNAFVEEAVITESGKAGFAIALSAAGNTLVVGAPGPNESVGLIRIYERINGQWIEVGEHVGTGAVAGFGYGMGSSVAISADGNVVAAGSPHGGTSSDGGAWIFKRINGVYEQDGPRLTGSGVIGLGNSHQWPLSLSNDGKTLAISGVDNGSKGAVWVFTDDGNQWTEFQKLVPPDNFVREMRYSVDLSGDGLTLAVGAPVTPYENGPQSDTPGATIVFEREPGESFTFKQKLQSTHYSVLKYQGRDVSISDNGSVLAVGEYHPAHLDASGVRIYLKVGNNWVEQAGKVRYYFSLNELTEYDPNDGQGYSVTISPDGTVLAMGSPDANYGIYLWESGPPPEITSFSPHVGGINTVLTINGSNLDRTQEVRVNGNLTNLFTPSAGQVRTTITGGTNSIGNILLTAKNGQVSIGNFEFVEPPVINSLDPLSGGPGTIVTVVGQNLQHISSATIGGATATIEVISDTQIELTVDKGSNGPVSLQTPGGSTVSLEDFHFVTPAPQIVNFFPASASPMAIVTITGTNLWWVDEVNIGGSPAASFSINEEGNIEAAVSIEAMSGEISVSSEGGITTIGGFTFVEPAPVIYAIDPSEGSVGTVISIFGENFQAATKVKVNATETYVLEKNAGRIRALAMPNSTTGSVDVEVGQHTASSQQHFTVTPSSRPEQQVGNIMTGTSPVANTNFGETLAVSADGSVVAIGASLDDTGCTQCGSVRMFERNHLGELVQVQFIQLPLQQSQQAGYALALSATGKTLVIAGKVTTTPYLYERNDDGVWELTHVLPSPTSGSYSIAISGDGTRLAFGRLSTSNNPIIVKVFHFVDGSWQQSQQISPPGEIVGLSRFPKLAFSLDGNTLAISSPEDNNRKGALWIYEYDDVNHNWMNDGTKLVPNDMNGANVQFGSTLGVTADGSRIVAGTPLESSNGCLGAFWSFAHNGNNWIQEAPKAKPQGFGAGSVYFATAISVSASGERVAVGAPSDNFAGAIYFFTWDGAAWVQDGNKVVPQGNGSQKGHAVVLAPNGNSLITTSRGYGFYEFRSGQQPSKQTPLIELQSQNCFVDDEPITLSASSNSDGAITYNIVSGGNGSGQIDGDQFTPLDTGTVHIRAFQQPTANFHAAEAFATITITANQVDQAITFEPIPNKTFGDGPFVLSAFASSGLPVVFEANKPSVATITGDVVTIVGVGEVTITASQPGNADFTPADIVEQTFTVNKGVQTITFSELSAKTFGDLNFTLTAQASSQLPVTFQSSDENVATIVGNQVTILAAGNVTITASQNGNLLYDAAPMVHRELTVAKADQQITFDPVSVKNFGDEPFTLSASASSGLPIIFESSNENIVAIDGDAATILGAGTVILIANQGGNANYNAAQSELELTVAKAEQIITFNPVGTKIFGDQAFTLSASANSGLPIIFESSNENIVAIDVNAATILGAGTVILIANQGGNANYNAAQSELQLTVAKAEQTIIFDPIGTKTFSAPDFALVASTSANLPVTFESSDLTVATVSGNVIEIVGAGTTIITASQAGDVNFNPASPVQRLLTVEKANQQILFDAISEKTFGESDFLLNAASDSGLPLALESSNPAVATVSGNQVTIVGAGVTTFTAVQPGNSNYKSASVQRTLTVKKAEQQIQFEKIGSKSFGDAQFKLNALATSGLHIDYSTANPAVAKVTGNEVEILKAGSVTITATQAGNANYNPAIATQDFIINKATQEISFSSIQTLTYGDAPLEIHAAASSGLPVSFISNDVSIATVSDNQITILGAGDLTLIAQQDGNENYSEAQSSQQIVIRKASQTITFNALESKNTMDREFVLEAHATSGLGVTFESDNSNIISISGTTATIKGPGTVTIRAVQEGNQNYLRAEAVLREQVVQLVSSVIERETRTTLYPNPTDAFVTLQLETADERTFSIVDVSGRKCSNVTIREMNSGKYEFDLRELSPGMYYIVVNELPGRLFRVVRR